MKSKAWLQKMIIVFGCGLFLLLMDGNWCVIKGLSGLPCPGCGMTRAYLSLLKFDLKNALYYHPLFWIPPLIGVVIVLRKKTLINFIYRCNAFWCVLAVVLIVVWVVRMVLFFPDTPPLDFNPHGLLPRILRFITKFRSY